MKISSKIKGSLKRVKDGEILARKCFMNGLRRYERNSSFNSLDSTTHGELHLIAVTVLYVLERGINSF